MDANNTDRTLSCGRLVAGKFASLLALAALAGAVGAGAGAAGTKPSASTCTVQSATGQPFLPWNDQSSYFLAPGGSFETKPAGWHFTGRVEDVTGNESFYVNSPSDSHSLWFGPNSYAQSTDICVSVHSPSIRLFALNTGDPRSTLQVTVNYTDKSGKPASAKIGQIKGTSAWAPTDSLSFIDLIAPTIGGQGQTSVSFTFHVIGAGNWQIDDFYVDPLKSQ
jgi:hypothetical protein